MITNLNRRTRIKAHIRHRVTGTAQKPRMTVFRSNTQIYAQLIDDEKGVTLGAAKGSKSVEVGKAIAESAAKKKIKKVVFDRGGFRYHGRIKALADAAREAGLEF